MAAADGRSSSAASVPTTAPAMPAIDVASLCEASARGDAKTVRACLLPAPTSTKKDTARQQRGAQGFGGPDEPLIPSNDVCLALHGLLFDDDGDTNGSDGGDSGCDEDQSCSKKRKRPASPRELLTNATSVTNHPPEAILRSLLLIPPTYATPWEAAIQTVTCIQRRDGVVGKYEKYDEEAEDVGVSTIVQSLVADIGTFLGTVGRGGSSSRRASSNNIQQQNGDVAGARDGRANETTTQRSMIRRLAELVVEPILLSSFDASSSSGKSEEADNTNQHIPLPLEILPALFAASKRLEGPESAIVGSILGVLFPSPCPSDSNNDAQPSHDDNETSRSGVNGRIRPSMVLHSLTLSPSLSPYMSPQHWLNLRRLILDSLPDIPLEDLAGLAKNIVNIATANNASPTDPVKSEQKNDDDTFIPPVPTWTELILHLYKRAGEVDSSSFDTSFNQASSRSSTSPVLPTFDSVLSTSLSSLPSASLINILDSVCGIPNDSNMPEWVRSNIVLLVAHSYGSPAPESLRNMIDEALSGSSATARGTSRRWRGGNKLAGVTILTLDAIINLAGANDEDDNDESNKLLHLSELKDFLNGPISETKPGHAKYEKLLYRLENLLLHGLFLGNHNGESDKLGRSITNRALERAISDRAERFLQVASSFLDHSSACEKSHNQRVRYTCFALASYGVAFRRLHRSQPSSLMSSVTEGICSSNSDTSALYCLVVSVLVRKAMAGVDRAILNGTATNDDESDFMQDELRHFGNLLAPDSLDIDHVGIVSKTGPLPPRTTLDLARALVRTLNCRRPILRMASSILSSSFDAGEGYTHVGGISAEAMSVAVEALCLLIRPYMASGNASPLNDATIRDEWSIEALLDLSDLLVLNRPALSLHVRCSMYQRLGDLARNGELHKWTCARLEGAASFLLLNHFGLAKARRLAGSSGPSLVFIPERSFARWTVHDEESSTKKKERISQVEDLPSLVSLLITLVSSRCSDPAGWKQELSLYLVSILSDRPSAAADEKEAFDNASLLQSGRQAQGMGDGLSKALVKLCLGAMAKGILDPSRRGLAFSEDESGVIELENCSLLQSCIAHFEKKMYMVEQRQQSEVQNTQTSLPKWVKEAAAQSSNLSQSKVFAADERYKLFLDVITSPLCSIFVDLLLCGSLANPIDSSRALELSFATNAVIQRSRAAAQDLIKQAKKAEPNDEGGSFSDPCSRSLIDHAHHFLELSSLAFSQEMVSKAAKHDATQDVKRLDMLLQGIERCCACIENNNAQGALDSQLIVPSLWKIYQAIASEGGACRFIHFLDKRLVRAKGAGLPDLKIDSHDDIDELVRSIRLAILSSLASLCKESSSQCTESDISLFFLLRTITILSNDLYRGLHGKSGGITRNIFMGYLTAIDACVEAVLSMRHDVICNEFAAGSCSTSAAANSALALCESSSIHLWNIPCKFPLDQEARTFKTTLDMCLSGLQSVRRHIEFVLAYATTDDACIKIEQTDLLSVASNKCLEALRSGSCTTKPRKRASSKVIEESSNGESSDDSYESDGNASGFIDSNSAQRSSVDAAKKAPSGASKVMRIPNTLRNLQVNTPNSWSWTQTTIFLAVETNWMESHIIIKSKNLNTLMQQKPRNVVAYVGRRHLELSSSLSCATSFLGDINLIMDKKTKKEALSRSGDEEMSEANKESGSKEAQEMLIVERMASTTKLRFCSTLDRITATLRAAIRNMSILLKEYDGTRASESSQTLPQYDARFAESLACFCAWASSNDGPSTLTSGARRWYHNEKTRYRVAKAKAKSGGYHLDQEPILGRLPKVLYQMEELEVAFQKLAGAIVAFSKAKDDKSATLLSTFDDIVPVMNNASSDERAGSFSSLVTMHRDRLATSPDSKLSSFDMALISFEDKEDELGTATLGKRKRRGRNTAIEKHLRQARRNIIRSRNEVVDEWLDLDASNADRNSSMDAFEDLEDFLVEG